jgi:hypothetical protein
MSIPCASIRLTVSRRIVCAFQRCIGAGRSHSFLVLVFVFYATATVVALAVAAGGHRDAIGYLASLFVLGSFGCQTMMPLRVLALVSNAAFIAYAVRNQLGPVLVLHALLLPINAVRLWQLMATPHLPVFGPDLKSAASLARNRSLAEGL